MSRRPSTSADALAQEEETRLPKGLMKGRLTVPGPKEVGRPPKQWEGSLQENVRALGVKVRQSINQSIKLCREVHPNERTGTIIMLVVEDGRKIYMSLRNLPKTLM